jgi:hypothetical protein
MSTFGYLPEGSGLRATAPFEQGNAPETASGLRTDARKVLIAASKDVSIIS